MICQDSFTAYEKEDDALLDLFFRTHRYSTQEYLNQLLEKCWSMSPLNTMRTIFYLRDCRGGKGEKRLFINLCQWLWEYHPLELKKCFPLIPHYGSFKDLKKLLHWQEDLTDHLIPFWCQVLTEDFVSKDITFAAKYVPIQDSRFCKELGLTHKEFRFMIRDLRDRLQDVDQPMANKEVGHLKSIVFHPHKRTWRKYLSPWKKTKKICVVMDSTCSFEEASLSVALSELSSDYHRQILTFEGQDFLYPKWIRVNGQTIHQNIKHVSETHGERFMITPKMISFLPQDITLVVITNMSWEKVVLSSESYDRRIMIWNIAEKNIDVCPSIVSNVTLVKGLHDVFIDLMMETGHFNGKSVFERMMHSSRYQPIQMD